VNKVIRNNRAVRHIHVKIFDGKPEESVKRRRPRLRWLEGVEKDLLEMQVKRWRKQAVDMEEGASVSKVVKAFRGTYSQAVSK
jgi:hypothetical protein